MADELHYSSRPDSKRKFDDPAAGAGPSPPARRTTGFSAPIASPSPDGPPQPPSYNSVPPPLDGIQLAKQRAQEIAARLFSDAEAKRPRVDNGGGADDSRDTGFSSSATDHTQKPLNQPIPSQIGMTAQSVPVYGYQGSSKKIEIPNGRVGVIIGKSGETIKYLQAQSGAKIQVTRDMDADPNSQTRSVELMGTSEQISRAEQLINDVLSEADAGASGVIAGRKHGGVQPGAEQFQMNVPNNKVGLVIGKGGETIKNMQARSGARIQVIPLHLPPGDTSTERTVYIDGTKEQIEAAKQLVNEVISEGLFYVICCLNNFQQAVMQLLWVVDNAYVRTYISRYESVLDGAVVEGRSIACVGAPTLCEGVGNSILVFVGLSLKLHKFTLSIMYMQNRVRNPAMAGGYPQQGYHPPRPQTSWGPAGTPPMQQPGYGYMPPGAYPGPPPQYNVPQPPYAGYPPPSSAGFSSGWDQTSNQPGQQTAPGTGYDYYNQQSQQQQQPYGGSSAPAGNTSYNYGQMSYGDAAYSQTTVGQQQSYGQDGYSSGYSAPAPQTGYSQPAPNVQTGYDQQSYGSTPGYGSMSNLSQDGSASAYGAQGMSTQAPPAQQAPSSQPSDVQGYTGQPINNSSSSYPSQATSPSGYGIPPTSQPGYGSQPPTMTGYGQAAAPSYGQPSQVQKPPGTQAVYGQGQQQALSTPSGYMQAAPVQSGYGQPPTSQSGYGQQQSYGVQTHNQPGYSQQQQQPYGDSYAGGGYSQPAAYSNDNAAAHGTYDASAATPAVSTGAAAISRTYQFWHFGLKCLIVFRMMSCNLDYRTNEIPITDADDGADLLRRIKSDLDWSNHSRRVVSQTGLCPINSIWTGDGLDGLVLYKRTKPGFTDGRVRGQGGDRGGMIQRTAALGRSGKRIHRESTQEWKRRGRTKKGCGSMVGRGGHPVFCARRRSARGCPRTILGKEREGGGGGRTVFSFSLIVIVFVNQAPFEKYLLDAVMWNFKT
ncbi:Far upstream element-binding protein [Musa troglodytarum]|uniref:Far upstream element-binding protein n=1 Tax=Musa troglodytarum TaxID=320322 RepID=A0A9E7G6F1_9LILI|nr:Far upstream element-binding protein [Musa troglodytarum]